MYRAIRIPVVNLLSSGLYLECGYVASQAFEDGADSLICTVSALAGLFELCDNVLFAISFSSFLGHGAQFWAEIGDFKRLPTPGKPLETLP